MTKMQAAHPEDWHVPHMVAAAEEARLRNHVGQAGLDQINLNTDLMAPGAMQKAFRSIEQSQRVFRALQEGIELDTRLKPMFTRLLYYLDAGMDPDQAIQKSVNEMANDQTGYSKENWPAWMNAPVIRRIVMFKKFPIQQTLNFYRAARQAMAGGEQAKVGAAQLFYMAAALSLVGGAMGLPPWEMIRLLMYIFNMMGFPVPGNWNVAKTKMEQGLGELVGENAAEAAMYGLPRLIGVDLSSRLALDGTLFFQQPKELTNDGIMAALGYAVGGAPASTGVNMLTCVPAADRGRQRAEVHQPSAGAEVHQGHRQGIRHACQRADHQVRAADRRATGDTVQPAGSDGVADPRAGASVRAGVGGAGAGQEGSHGSQVEGGAADSQRGADQGELQAAAGL